MKIFSLDKKLSILVDNLGLGVVKHGIKYSIAKMHTKQPKKKEGIRKRRNHKKSNKIHCCVGEESMVSPVEAFITTMHQTNKKADKQTGKTAPITITHT